MMEAFGARVVADPRAEHQLGCFAAGIAFARAEEILPAPRPTMLSKPLWMKH